MTLHEGTDTEQHQSVTDPWITHRFGARGRHAFNVGSADDRDPIRLANAVACAGGTEADLFDVVSASASCGDWFGRLRPARAAQQCARWWADAQRWCTARPPARPVAQVRTARQAILVLAEAADRRDWGRGSCRRVHEAILGLAWDRGRVRDLHISERAIAERAGVHHSTVIRCARRLADMGLVTVRRPTTLGHATSWTLVLAAGTHGAPGDLDGSWADLGRVDWTADAFRWAGVGTDGARVDHALDGTPTTVDQLAARLDLQPRRVRRLLDELAEVGRARAVDDGWVRGPATLSEAAAQMGPAVDGAGARQRARHDRERRGHAEYLAWRRDSEPEETPTGGIVVTVMDCSPEVRARWSRPPDLTAAA